jgi:hypothetical protein
MNQKMITIASGLAAALLTGIFSTTTMAVYADGDNDRYDGDKNNRDGESNETNTEQKLGQENIGSEKSTNTNCGQNTIRSLAISCFDPSVNAITPFP